MPGFEQVARRLGEQRLEGVHAERELDPQQRVQPYVELPGLDAPPACPIEASESSGVLLRHVCRISEVPHASGEPITSGLEDFCIGGVAGQRPNDFLRFGSSFNSEMCGNNAAFSWEGSCAGARLGSCGSRYLRELLTLKPASSARLISRSCSQSATSRGRV